MPSGILRHVLQYVELVSLHFAVYLQYSVISCKFAFPMLFAVFRTCRRGCPVTNSVPVTTRGLEDQETKGPKVTLYHRLPKSSLNIPSCSHLSLNMPVDFQPCMCWVVPRLPLILTTHTHTHHHNHHLFRKIFCFNYYL